MQSDGLSGEQGQVRYSSLPPSAMAAGTTSRWWAQVHLDIVSCEESRSKDVNDLSEVPVQHQAEDNTEAIWCTRMMRSMTSATLDGRYCFGMIQVTESGKRHPIFSGSKKPYDPDAANRSKSS